MAGSASLLIASNRGPLSVVPVERGDDEIRRGGGGLVSGMQAALAKSQGAIWVCAAMNDRLRRRLAGADLVFFDGTLWRDDEMIRMGVGQKTGRRMGHMSMSGEDGTISWPFSAKKFRKVDLISLTPLMIIQSGVGAGRPARTAVPRRNAFRGAPPQCPETVQADHGLAAAR